MLQYYLDNVNLYPDADIMVYTRQMKSERCYDFPIRLVINKKVEPDLEHARCLNSSRRSVISGMRNGEQ